MLTSTKGHNQVNWVLFLCKSAWHTWDRLVYLNLIIWCLLPVNIRPMWIIMITILNSDYNHFVNSLHYCVCIYRQTHTFSSMLFVSMHYKLTEVCLCCCCFHHNTLFRPNTSLRGIALLPRHTVSVTFAMHKHILVLVRAHRHSDFSSLARHVLEKLPYRSQTYSQFDLYHGENRTFISGPFLLVGVAFWLCPNCLFFLLIFWESL